MMYRKLTFILVLVLSLAITIPAFADGPSFAPAIYADGRVFSTKGLAILPAPNDNNLQSFDKLFQFANGNNPAQLAVSEAGPGNPDFNGGRWFAHTVVWDQDFLDSVGGMAPLVTSYQALAAHHAAGHLTVTPGAISGPTYFECPLVPVKG